MASRVWHVGTVCGLLAALMVPSTPALASIPDESQQQWNIASGSTYGVHAAESWAMSEGDGATIAMLDSGLTPHPDLTGSAAALYGGNVVAGYDFISDPTKAVDGDGWDSDPTDLGHQSDREGKDIGLFAHGEQTAGVAAALRNGFGIAGVAPKATIVPVRVTGDQWWVSDDDDFSAAIRWSAGYDVSGVPHNDHPADVVNISVAVPWPTCPDPIQDAIDAAVSKNVAVVVAAGNTWTPSGPRDTTEGTAPANCKNVIRVTASTASGVLENYSNVGNSAVPATIAAPGSIRSLCPVAMPSCDGGYIYTTGTSMSVPHVAGAIALLRAFNHRLSVPELTSLLTSTATPFATACTAQICGAGILNAAAALSKAKSGTAPPPPIPAPSVTLTRPQLTGSAKVGRLLAVTTSAQPSTARLSVRWLRNGVAIPGATGLGYRATAADLGTAVSAEVSARLGISTAKRSSASVRIKPGAFARHLTPRVTGTTRVGRRLSANHGTWSPTPTKYAYQWLLDGHQIAGANKAHYRLRRQDRGHSISVRVTVKRAAYASRSSTSAKRWIR